MVETTGSLTQWLWEPNQTFLKHNLGAKARRTTRIKGYSSSEVIFVSTTPPTRCRLACISPAYLTRFTRFHQYFVSSSASIGLYILQTSLSLRLIFYLVPCSQ